MPGSSFEGDDELKLAGGQLGAANDAESVGGAEASAVQWRYVTILAIAIEVVVLTLLDEARDAAYAVPDRNSSPSLSSELHALDAAIGVAPAVPDAMLRAAQRAKIVAD